MGWFSRKKKEPGIDSRGLFWYRNSDGRKFCADAFDASRKLEDAGGENWTEGLSVLETARVATEGGDPKLAQAAGKMRAAAFKELVSITRKAFGLSDNMPAGFTDAECFIILSEYLAAVAEVGGKMLPLPKLPA